MGRERLAVIGGGPAGLQSALTGIEKEFEVILFEKGSVGENFCCAEGFFDALKLLKPPEEGVCFKVNEIVLKAKSPYKIDCTDLNLWMLDRKKWQRNLKGLAENKGVDVREDTKILPRDLEELKKSFNWIIDATGVNSLTKKYYNLEFSPRHECAPAYQVTLEGDFSYLENRILVGIKPNYIGYYWIFPKGKNKANVGLVFFNRVGEKNGGLNLKKELENVLEKENLTGYKTLEKGGGLIPVKMEDRLVYDNIILAGDAAGLASPLHGGGIDLALISGDLAVRSLAIDELKYKEKLVEIIGDRLKIEKQMVNIWSKLGYHGVEELLELLLKRKSLRNIPKLFKYKGIISGYKEVLVNFYKGFFEGKWP